MLRVQRLLAVLCCAALALSSLPREALAVELEGPNLGAPRTPGPTPVVPGLQLPGQIAPNLPISEIPSQNAEGPLTQTPQVQTSASVDRSAQADQTQQAAPERTAQQLQASAQAQIPEAHPRAVGLLDDSHLAAHEAQFHLGGGGRIASHLRELGAWTGPRAETGDEAAPPAEGLGSLGREALLKAARVLNAAPSEIPSPDNKPTPQAPKKGRPWFGLGAAAALFIVALALQQVGIESQGAAMPALLQKTFHDVTVVADITIVASLGSIVGRILGPVVVNRLSLKKAYLGSLGAKLVVSAVMAGLLATARITVPGLAVLYGINGVLSGISMTAEKAIGPALLGQDQDKLERFGAGKQVVLETIGSILPIATGALVASLGFMPALVAFPVAFGASILLLAKFLKIPERIEQLRKLNFAAASASGKKPSAGAQFGDFFKKIARGAKVVWSSPALKYAFLAYTAFMVLNPFLYTVLAPTYGVLIAGANEAQQAAIYTMLTGLYSAGGLLGGILMLVEQRKLKKLPEGEVKERLRKSMLRWMTLGTLALGAIATLAIPMHPLIGALTLPALALFVFGVAQVIANIKQENYFVSRVPEKDVNDAIGFMGSASLAISTLGLVALKFLFTGKLPFGFHPFAFAGLHGFAPFVAIAIAMVPLAFYFLYLRGRLDKASRAAPPPPQA